MPNDIASKFFPLSIHIHHTYNVFRAAAIVMLGGSTIILTIGEIPEQEDYQRHPYLQIQRRHIIAILQFPDSKTFHYIKFFSAFPIVPVAPVVTLVTAALYCRHA